MMKEESVEKVQYLTFEQLHPPAAQTISQGSVELGFQSKEWYIQFQTITNLRQANRYYSSLFKNQLLPLNYKHILAQVENLRSNNSKEALTLISEILQHQQLQDINSDIIRPLVAALMSKSVSQKNFIKSEAIKSLNILPLKWNEWVLEQLCEQTQVLNGQISETAIRLLGEMVQNNKTFESNGKFLKSLSININGKRAFVQRKAKQILNGLKKREGEENLQLKITKSQELLQEESTTLRRELKQKEEKPKGPSLKEFLKQKKQQG